MSPGRQDWRYYAHSFFMMIDTLPEFAKIQAKSHFSVLQDHQPFCNNGIINHKSQDVNTRLQGTDIDL